MRKPRFTACAFGLRWGSDHPLRQFSCAPADGAVDVSIERVDSLPKRIGGRRLNNGEIFADGARFRFGESVFDTFGSDRVLWSSPCESEVPAAFYGTVAAIVLAWRGLVPLHGSAVTLGGNGLMIAGASGAGKSTLCDALVRRGAHLISDDLTVLQSVGDGGRPLLQPGRPAIRLAPRDAATHGGGKRLHPVSMVPLEIPVPFGAMVILRDRPIPIGPVEASAVLTQQLFRPQWMRALPFHRGRMATILRVAPQLAIFAAPAATDRPDIHVDDKALMVIDRMLGLARRG